MLECRTGLNFLGIMLRILGFRVSGGILPGISWRTMDGGLGTSSRFFGTGCGLGIPGRRAESPRGGGIKCIPFILR
jgi:hypothetical protein